MLSFTPPPSFSFPPPSGQVLPIPPRRRLTRTAALSLPPPLLRLPIPFLISTFTLIRTRALPESVVRRALEPLLGTRVTRAQIFSALQPVDVWLTSRGYVASRVAVAAFPSRANAHTLIVAAVEPVLVSVRLEAVDADQLIDEGVELRTTEGTVARALGVKVGDVFKWHPRAFDRLWALGVFESARAEMEVYSPTEVGIVLSVRERKNARVEPGLGINSDGQSYGDLSASDANFLGRAVKLRLEWQRRLGMQRSMGGLEIEDPRVGARVPFALRGKAFRDVGSDRGLPGGEEGSVSVVGAANDSDRQGVLLEAGWSPGGYPRLALSGGPVVERVKSGGNGGLMREEDQAMWLMSGNLDLTELGNPMPRKGRRIALEYGVGTGIGARGTPDRRQLGRGVFHRFVARAAQYFPLGGAGSLAFGGSVGFGTQNLPWHEQKPLGGPGSVRGYHYGELGRSPVFATGRVEFRVPLITADADDEDDASKGSSGDTGDESAIVPGPGEDGAQNGKARSPFAGGSGDGSGSGGGAGARRGASSRDGDGKLVITKDGIKGEVEGGETVGKVNRYGLPKLPSVVGVLFADAAKTDVLSKHVTGSCHGIGLRIGGIISVEYGRSQSGREPRLHFGLVDRSL